jgi:hypothetical protein
MTGYDIKTAMHRAFGINDKFAVEEMETLDIGEIGNRVRRLLLLFSLGTRGTL